MAHNRPCEQATQPECRCSGCGGSEHGWRGHLERAGESAEKRAQRRSAAEQRWLAALGGLTAGKTRPVKPNQKTRRAAAALAREDITDWLAQRKTMIKNVAEIGKELRDCADKTEIFYRESAAGRQGQESVRRSLTGHFWCALLVELAHAVETCDSYLGRVPHLAADALLGGGDPKEWDNDVQRRIGEYALGIVWRHVNPLLPVDLQQAARLLRVLAVFICPDPGWHDRIVQRGLMPLTRDVLSGETEARLYRVFGDPADTTDLVA